jgi:hypothetical protein
MVTLTVTMRPSAAHKREVDQAKMKAEARSQYVGSDDAFEQDWPEIRERIVMENLEKELKKIPTGL